jgi:hypothetical protein
MSVPDITITCETTLGMGPQVRRRVPAPDRYIFGVLLGANSPAIRRLGFRPSMTAHAHSYRHQEGL